MPVRGGLGVDPVHARRGAREQRAVDLARLDVERHPRAVAAPAGWVHEDHRLVDRRRPGVLVEQRERRGGIPEAGVERGVRAPRPWHRVIGAVVDHPHHAVGPGARDDPSWCRDRAPDVGDLHGQRLLHRRPHRVVGREREAEHALGRPVGRGRAGVALREPRPRAVPAEGEHAVVVGRAVVGEVPNDAGGGAAQRTGRERGDLGHRTHPERRGRGEAVDEAAALDERAAVGADEGDRVGEEAVQLRAVALGALDGEVGRAGHPRPQRGVQVQRPAGVVVEGALRAVGEPAVGAHEGVVGGEVSTHLGEVVRPADRAQERLHDEPEPDPS